MGVDVTVGAVVALLCPPPDGFLVGLAVACGFFVGFGLSVGLGVGAV